MKNAILIKSIFLFIIAFLYLERALVKINPYPTGDGPEYILTTEALYNHYTPDIRLEDAVSFKKSSSENGKWENNLKFYFFDELENDIRLNNVSTSNLVTDKIGRHYGYHFFFYPLINVPGRYIAEKLHANPLRNFQVTNAVLVILVCFFLLFFSPFSLWPSVLITFSFCFSSVYWYLGWTHTEVYMVCVVTLGMWFFFQNKYYLGIFLVALGGLQYQPLLMVLIFMAITTILKNGMNAKNILKLFFHSVIFLWPPIFYLIHFGTINLIGDMADAMSIDNITLTRIFGFYFDFNQGAILGIPLALLLYIFFCCRKWILMLLRKEAFDFSYSLIFFLLITTCIVSAIWCLSPIGAIVNRYSTWISAIILIHLFFIIMDFKKIIAIVLLSCISLTQMITVLYHKQYAIYDWCYTQHLPLAKWFLEEHPSLYNPEPQIFIARTMDFNFYSSASPVIYIKNCKTVTKMAIHKDSLGNLVDYGFTKEQIDLIKPKLTFVNDWAYLNEGEFKSTKTGAEIYQIIRQKKILLNEQKIRNSPEWLKQEGIKAKSWNKTIDEVIKKDAEWMMKETEKNN